MRAALNYVGQALARLAGVPPREVKKPAPLPLCKHESDHQWEAKWIGDDIVYWGCTKCPAVRESFGDPMEQLP